MLMHSLAYLKRIRKRLKIFLGRFVLPLIPLFRHVRRKEKKENVETNLKICDKFWILILILLSIFSLFYLSLNCFKITNLTILDGAPAEWSKTIPGSIPSPTKLSTSWCALNTIIGRIFKSCEID